MNHQTNINHQEYVALFQEKVENGKVKCTLCPHECVLADGATGICHARKNIAGTLFSLAYNRPCSINIDPIEKKPLFHFLPGQEILSIATAGCNFRCLNCQNWQISQSSPLEQKYYQASPSEIISIALQQNVKMIAFTYTEPTIFYEYMIDIARLAHEEGLKTAIVSNGYINHQPLLELIPYVDAANIDLKCFRDSTYRKLTGGNLSSVLNTLKTLKENGVWLEITNLLIPQFNDDPEQISEMCHWLADNGFKDTPLHFSKFFPTFKLNQISPTPERLLKEAKRIALDTGINYVYIGNIAHTDDENTYCPQCQHLVVERWGFNVVKNNLKNGCCNFCGQSIPGVWD